MTPGKFTSLKALKAQGERLHKDFEAYKENVEWALEKKEKRATKAEKKTMSRGMAEILDFVRRYKPTREEIIASHLAEISKDGELWTKTTLSEAISALVRENRIILIGRRFQRV